MQTPKKIPFWLKILYGSGEWGISSIGMMRSIFYAIYLTDVVGLEPRLASFGALAGIVWDAINDPIVGYFTDHLSTRWGRRRPFLLWFAIPFGLSFVILWSAPNWDNQIALTVYVTLAFMLADTLQTLISVPYLSLTPELAHGYDERTTLTSYRTVFQLIASLAVVVTAPSIIEMLLVKGYSQQQGFMLVGALFGFTGAIPLLLLAYSIRETSTPEQAESMSFRDVLRVAWRNVPFRYAAGMFMFNWSAVDMIAVAFPYFLLYWVAQGDLLENVQIFGFQLALESAFFGVLLLVCILFVPFWLWLAKKYNKRQAYIAGMLFWVVVQLLIFTIPPHNVTYLLVIAALAGVGVSAAYVLPDSLFADIIEWDELLTRRRQEGVYFGARAFIRKLTGALIIFITLQSLGWSGYQTPPVGVTNFPQSENALLMIRLLVSPLGAILLFGAVIFAWLFPLTRERYERIQKLLDKRAQKKYLQQ